MKSVVSVLELITAAIILFVSLSFILPKISFHDYWEKASLLTINRDFIISMKRLGVLYSLSFDQNKLNDFITNSTRYENFTFIAGKASRNAIKSVILVACNCSDSDFQQLKQIQTIYFNNRSVSLNFFQISLDNLTSYNSDVLLIVGYRNLTPYLQTLKQYLAKGSGIVEFSDIPVPLDYGHQQLYKINATSSLTDTITKIVFAREPSNASDILYKPYKYFNYLPLFFNTTNVSTTISGCLQIKETNLSFYSKNYRIDVCNSTFVYYDSDGDGTLDANASLRSFLTIENQSLFLNSIGKNQNFVSISFRNFNYSNFLPSTFANLSVSDTNRIVLIAVGSSNYTAAVINDENGQRTAISFNLFKNGLDDSEKNIVQSFLIWASNKKEPLPTYMKFGIYQDYINSEYYDLFEVYTFTLTLSYPF